MKKYSENKSLNNNKFNKPMFFYKLKKWMNVPRFIAILILVSSILYFAHFYFYNNSNYYIELTKGLVFPKNPIASADPIFYK